MEIKAHITHVPNGYGFGHDWTLVITKDGIPRKFWLGQDAKVCSRIIGLSPSDVVDHIGGNDIDNPVTNEKLAHMIIEQYGSETTDTIEEIMEAMLNAEPWEICAE